MNPLQQLQEDCQALLLGNPDTNVVPFSIYRKQLIQSVQDEALAAWKVRVPGKVGLACLVMMPSLRVVTPEVPGPQYEVSILIRTFHDPRVNNTDLSAEDVGMLNLRWLDGQIIEGITQLHGDTRGEALKPNYDYPGLLTYDSTLTGPLPQDIAGRTAAPEIADDNEGNVTLTCADSGAQIYFTIDGSAPMPPANDSEQGASTVRLYAAPFGVPSGLVVKCLAWNRALLPSHIASGTVIWP